MVCTYATSATILVVSIRHICLQALDPTICAIWCRRVGIGGIVTQRKSTRILVFGDVHAPYHDVEALALARRAAKCLKPDIIVTIGDFADCYAISQYPKDPRRRADLKWEVDAARKEHRRLRDLCGTLVAIEGNHENRLERYVAEKAPQLFGMVSSRELLGCDDITWVPYRSIHRIGKCAFTHDVGHSGVNCLRASLQAYGSNIVFGHSHRAGVYYDGNMRGESHFALNVGWLGDASKIDYTYSTTIRSWQHGLGLVEQDAQGRSWASFAPMVGGKIVVAGVTIT